MSNSEQLAEVLYATGPTFLQGGNPPWASAPEVVRARTRRQADRLLASDALVQMLTDARAEALREARDEIDRMLDGFPHQGRHTRARWAVAWLDIMLNRAALTDEETP